MAHEELTARQRYDRERYARLKREALVCPECRERRSTPETLRVHRWLAHDVRVMSEGSR